MPRPVASVVLLVAGSVLALAGVAAHLLAGQTDPDRVLVVGGLGPGSLREIAWAVGVLAFLVVLVVGSWVVTARARPVLRVAVRVLAGLATVAGLLLLCAGAWLSLLGTTRYLDVGTVDGRAVVVEESDTLGGVSVDVGFREGWTVVRARTSDPVARAGASAGPPPSSGDGYRVRREGGSVVVTFSLAGEERVVRADLPR